LRVIFSIILNGKHHLLHHNQADFILSHCDYWIVVEGASLPNGSTSWCKSFPESFHHNGGSVDGTREYLTELASHHSHLIYIPSNGFWHSKDVQVNIAIQKLKELTDRCFLWEMDIDEHWTTADMAQAEQELVTRKLKMGRFRADCYVGNHLKAIGDWGESYTLGYNRLWQWKGESFKTHEPPVLKGTWWARDAILTPRFRHYNYYFEWDVKFKDQWYGDVDRIYERWVHINSLPKEAFPLPISSLITGYWGRTNAQIIWEDTPPPLIR